MSYSFLDSGIFPVGPIRFIACYLEVLKEQDPELHESICAKQREMMKGIKPNSGEGPSYLEFIKDVLKQANEKRFYEVMERLDD